MAELKFNKKKISVMIISVLIVAVTVLLIVFRNDILDRLYEDYKAPEPSLASYLKSDNIEPVNGDFYVSTNGDDSNSGTSDFPFKTIERAIRAVRNTDKSDKNSITVCIEGGEYRVSSLVFEKEDSGTSECPVVYRSYNGEVILNGGINLNPSIFTSVTDENVRAKLSDDAKNNVICADLTKLGLNADDWGKLYPVGKYGTQEKYDGDTSGPVPCNLYFNGSSLTTARYPNDGFLNTVEIIREGDGQESSTSNHAKRADWDDLRNPQTTVFTVDADTAERLNSYSTLENVWLWTALIYEWADTTVPIKSFDYDLRALEPAYVSKYGAVSGSTYYIFNAIEELDTAGEWYLDRESGMLYMYPPDKTDGAKIMISLSADNLITVNNAEHLCFDGLTLRGTRGNGIVINSNNVTVRNCLITELSGTGVAVDGFHNLIENCEFSHIGATAADIKGGERESLTAGDNCIKNCLIHDFSEVSITEGQGVNLGGVGNICSHNEIYNSPQQAILYGGNNNIIEYNNIHNVALLSSDSSAIYTGRRWDEVGTVIRYNAIYNIGGEGFTPHGIYFDDGASAQNVYGNLIINCNGYGFMIGGGRNHSIHNNIIINCDKAFYYDERSINAVLDPDFWFEHSRESLDMHQNLLDSPWKRDAWKSAYPFMSEWSLDYSDTSNPAFIPNPSESIISGNIIIHYENEIGEIADRVYEFSNVSGNKVFTFHSMRNLFVDHSSGNYSIKDLEKIKKFIPDFENIPLDKIGRIN